ARGGLTLMRRVLETGIVNLAEYLGHERHHLVPRAEGEQFLRGVDAVREDLDRLQARLDVLARRGGLQGHCGCCCDCWRSSACCCGTDSTITCAPRTCTGRCALYSICPPRCGSRVAAA